MKKIIVFLAIISVLAIAFTACGLFGTQDGSGESNTDNKKYDYIIQAASVTQPVGEVGEMYKIEIPKVINKGGEEVEDFKVKIKELKDADGNKVVAAAGRFTPKNIGKYSVTFTCNDDRVKECTMEIVISDTVAPSINVAQVPGFLFLSSNNGKPDFTVKDVGGVDEASKNVQLYDKSGNEVSFSGGKFDLTVAGYYTFKFSVNDKSGNVATAEKQIFVADMTPVDGQLTYLGAETYDMVTAYRNETEKNLLDLEWTNNLDPDGNPTMKITTGAMDSIYLGIECAINDWSEYDYVGFWIYNPTNIHLAVGFDSASTMSFVLNPNAWTYACFPAKTNSFYDVDRNLSEYTNRKQVVLYVGDRFTMDNSEAVEMLPEGSEFYISNMTLYKDETDNIFSFGEKYAYYQLGIHQKYMEYSVLPTTEYVFEGDSVATKFTLDNVYNSFNVAMYTKTPIKQDAYYLLNVYNPNDYDIVVIDVSCDAFAKLENNGEGNFSTLIPAGESRKVLIKYRANENYAYIMALKPDGSELPNGASIIIGSSHADDVYTGDITTWNEENGVPGLWAEYKKKNPILSQ